MSQFDLECDWHLLDGCNYRCEYCYFTEEFLSRKIKTYATLQEWRSAFDGTGLIWLLHITGGEPTLYPEFVELCVSLSEKHYISLNTNLTNKSILEFSQRVNSARVLQINASLHYDERVRKQGLKQFTHHVIALRERGHRVVVSFVATPQNLERFEVIIDSIKDTGLFPVPKILYGSYGGGIYPGAYTLREKKLFLIASEMAKIAYGVDVMRDDNPSVDLFSDGKIISSTTDHRGELCEAGRLFVRLDKDGSVHRCSSKSYLGNLLNGTLKLFLESRACDTSYCEYFCRRYTALAKEKFCI